VLSIIAFRLVGCLSPQMGAGDGLAGFVEASFEV
jgi:hypothetical protein